MIEVRLLGQQSVIAADGSELLSVSAQPKRLALLVYLAVSGAAGDGYVSRDELLALFWPESDQDRSRNTLNQHLFRLRGSLGSEAILSHGASRLGLDVEQIWCDVVEFRSATKAKEWQLALDLYAGDFLAGFHVSETPELEKWLDNQRLDCQRRALEAALDLARQHDSVSDWAEAVRWYRRATEITPESEPAMRGLSSALDRAEDHAPVPPAEESSASIAVLPFADMSPNRDQEYFSDGISEELLNLLGKIPELRVAARTSSFSFKGQNLAIPEIAGRLNVAHILEGSVRKAGNQVRITVQLVRAEDGFHVWSETWDRTLNDIFAIQDEIAVEVAEQLKVTLLGAAPAVEQTDPAAYALFLQARQLGYQATAESLEQSNALYRQALQIDPDYAAAWAGLATNYRFQAILGLLPIAEGFGLASEAANRALAIDPESAWARSVLGLIASDYDNDLAAAARHTQRALELASTDTEILLTAAFLSRHLGRLDEAIALCEFAVVGDPVNPSGHVGLGFAYLADGRLNEAIASLRSGLSLSPGRIGAQYGIGLALLEKGESEAALAAMQQESNEGYRLIGLTLAYHVLGQTAESDAMLGELIDKYEQDRAYNIAYVLSFRGEADRAFEWLDKAVQYNDPGMSVIAAHVVFANIHSDPRWLPFLESIGKSPAQLAAIEFEVRLPR